MPLYASALRICFTHRLYASALRTCFTHRNINRLFWDGHAQSRCVKPIRNADAQSRCAKPVREADATSGCGRVDASGDGRTVDPIRLSHLFTASAYRIRLPHPFTAVFSLLTAGDVLKLLESLEMIQKKTYHCSRECQDMQLDETPCLHLQCN